MELNPGSVSLEQLLAIFAVLNLEVVVGSRSSAVSVSAAQTLEPVRQNVTARVRHVPSRKPEW